MDLVTWGAILGTAALLLMMLCISGLLLYGLSVQNRKISDAEKVRQDYVIAENAMKSDLLHIQKEIESALKKVDNRLATKLDYESAVDHVNSKLRTLQSSLAATRREMNKLKNGEEEEDVDYVHGAAPPGMPDASHQDQPSKNGNRFPGFGER